MLALDLFNTKYERDLTEGAVDDLEARRIDDLNMRMLELLDRAKEPAYKKNPAALAGLKKQFQKIKAERDSYFKINPATGMNDSGTLGTTKGKLDEVDPPQRPPAKGLLKNKDLITPQQRVAAATPANPGISGAVKDVAGGLKRWLKGEPDSGPTYEATIKKKDSNAVKDVQNLAVQRYLTKVRRENPMAYSDLEAISKHEMDKEKQTQANIDRLQQTQKTTLNQVTQDNQLDQAQSQLIKDLENQVNSLSTAVQGISAPVAATPEPAPTTPAPAVAVSGPTAVPTTAAVAKEPAQMPSQMPKVPGQPKTTQADLPKKDKNILRRVRGIQKRLEKRVDQYADKKSADTAQKIQDLQSKLDAETAKLSDQGQDVVQPSAQVIDFRSRLKGAGISDQSEPGQRTGTFGEQQSPVIGAMAQQLTKQPSPDEIYTRNMQAFTQAYEKTRGTKLNYGGSANIPLPFSDMDALVSTITAFPASQKGQIWKKLFTDPNYLTQFMDQYVEQRGLIEGDVVSLAQQRQAPAQLKAYNLALEIMKSARDTRVSPARVDQMKQILFKDFGTRIQQRPDKSYYIVFDGKQINLPNPATFALEHGGGIGPRQHWQDLMPEQMNPEDYEDEDEDDRLRSGDYVRDRQDGEYGEIFRMQGDPYERRVRILDRDGKGWYIEPSRLTRVDPTDHDVQRYFGKKRVRDMDEAVDEKGALKSAQAAAKFIIRNLDDRAALKDYSMHFWSPEKFYQGATMAMRGAGVDEIVRQITQDRPAQFESGVAEGWSDAMVSRRTGTPRTPYAVYIKGKKWKDFENEELAQAVADKLRAKFKADGRDPETVTIAPTDYDRPIKEEQDTSGVERAIINRIMVAHTDLLMQFDPDKVMQAAEEVAYNVGDVDEIGNSDVSAYVAQVKQILGATP